jgi:hypothetical protein
MRVLRGNFTSSNYSPWIIGANIPRVIFFNGTFSSRANLLHCVASGVTKSGGILVGRVICNVAWLEQILLEILHFSVLKNPTVVQQSYRGRRIIVHLKLFCQLVNETDQVSTVQLDTPSILPAVAMAKRQTKT